MYTCDHSSLSFETPFHATRVGYRKPSLKWHADATSDIYRDNCLEPNPIIVPNFFPAPLVLPADDLSLGPGCSPQSLREWLCEEDRNEASLGKNVIYVATLPDVQASVDFVSSWTHPQERVGKVAHPNVQDAIDYLKAFYYGLLVRQLSSQKLSFTAWSTEATKSKVKSPTSHFIGLDTFSECIRIRTRPPADDVIQAPAELGRPAGCSHQHPAGRCIRATVAGAPRSLR
jgi:archaemetzincin